MCGIAGWVDFQRDLSGQRVTVQTMTDTMACRGPDEEGVWLGHHAAFGHRRLSVIDLRGGRQPMTAGTEGRALATLTYSGEVYNFRELRSQLESHGQMFRTRSDTEVLLRAYLHWGEGFVDRLVGMYAFGLWDHVAERLLLVRDRMGVKPLYYLPTAHGVLFGSEPKVILSHPAAPRRVTADGLCEALEMVKTPESAIYAGMHEVRPGHLVEVHRTGLNVRRYWSLEAREHPDDLPTTILRTRDLLTDVVRGQLVSDVPMGTLLSGGLDSSAVTALAARTLADERRGPVRSFSVDFVGRTEGFEPDGVREAPDAPFVRDLVAHVSTDHTEVLLSSDDLVSQAVRAAVLRACDQPPTFWGDMWPSLYLLFQGVRRQSTVVLSGEAADELFGGYRWFRNPAAIHADTFPWSTPGSARYFGGLGLLDEGLKKKLNIPAYRQARYHEAAAETPVLAGENGDDRRMRLMFYLNLTRFVQTLLDRKDRMSMAVGLEVRVPFCDHRLVEYVFNVPWDMKSFDGREKSLLRAAVADLLPRSITERVKVPYPATQDPYYEQALRRELAALLADRNAPARPLLNVPRARALAEAPIGDLSQPYDRGGLETALWLNAWLASYDVTLDL